MSAAFYGLHAWLKRLGMVLRVCRGRNSSALSGAVLSSTVADVGCVEILVNTSSNDHEMRYWPQSVTANSSTISVWMRVYNGIKSHVESINARVGIRPAADLL